MAIYFLIGIATVLAVLFIAAAINARRIKARPGDEAASLACCEDMSDHGEELAQMIRIPTVSCRNKSDAASFDALHDVMSRLFPKVFSLERFDKGGNLLIRWPGKDSARAGLLLMGHQDVVPAPSQGWKHPPFDGVIDNGAVYGRGALDCKSTVFAEFQAVEELINEGFAPPCDIYLSASVDEETSGCGAQWLVEELLRRGVRLDLVLDEGGSLIDSPFPGIDRRFALIGVAEKGGLDVRISAKSPGGHSSTPPLNTPIARLSAFVNEVERTNPFKKRLSPTVSLMMKSMAPYFPFGLRLMLGNQWLFKPVLALLLALVSPYGKALTQTTCVFTMSGASDAPNVIPSEAFVVANLRMSEHQNSQDSLNVLKRIGKKYGLDFEVLDVREAAPCINVKSPAFDMLWKTIARCFPDAVISPYLIMGGTDCRHYAPLADTNARFSPVYMNKQQMSSCHAADENVFVSALSTGVAFYKRLILNWQ